MWCLVNWSSSCLASGCSYLVFDLFGFDNSLEGSTCLVGVCIELGPMDAYGMFFAVYSYTMVHLVEPALLCG